MHNYTCVGAADGYREAGQQREMKQEKGNSKQQRLESGESCSCILYMGPVYKGTMSTHMPPPAKLALIIIITTIIIMIFLIN